MDGRGGSRDRVDEDPDTVDKDPSLDPPTSEYPGPSPVLVVPEVPPATVCYSVSVPHPGHPTGTGRMYPV